MKMCHFVFDYISGMSCAIFTIFVPAETGMNALQFTLLNGLVMSLMCYIMSQF